MFHSFNKYKVALSNLMGILIILAMVPLSLSCSGDDGGDSKPQIVIGAVSQPAIIDNGNAGDSRDFFISFVHPTNEEHIQEYNLILVKSSSSTQISSELARALDTNKYYRLTKSGTITREQITSTFLDADGEPIVPDQTYNAYIYSRPTDEAAAGNLSTPASVELEAKPYYEVKTFITFPGMESISYYEPGNYFIGPSANNTLIKVDLSSGVSSQFASGMATPYGGGFDPATGTYYISNFDTGEVWGFDTNGTRTVIITGLNGPTGIAVDKEGNLFINNYWSSTITKVNDQGQKSTFSNNTSGLIKGPDGIIFAGDQLYCINFDNPDVLKIGSAGEVSLFARLPGAETGYLAHGDGNFYVASLSERKIFRINQNGQHEAIAGNGATTILDGPAPLAGFSGPNGIAVVDGIVYVSDGNTLRMIIRHN